MSHIEDLWWRDEPDPANPGKFIKFKKADYGKGMRYKVRWTPPGEPQTSKSFPDKKKREAEAFRTTIDNAINQRTYVDPKIGEKPFNKVAAEWLKGTSPDPSSRKTTETQMRLHIIPFFKGYTIARAGRAESVRNYLEWVNARGLDPFYVVLLFRQLSSIMGMAVAEKYITENPCRAKGITAPKADRKILVPWRDEKVRAIHDALPERNKIIVPLGAGMGLRRGEILAVDIGEDLNRADMTFHVQRQIRRLPDGSVVFSLPKHDKTRMLPVSKWAVQQIDDYVDVYKPVPVTLPWRVPEGHRVTYNLLMTREDAKVWYGELFHATVWRGAFKAAGLTMRRRIDGAHQLRHYFASIQLANLVSIRELADYLGHADPALTLRTYTHLVPGSYDRSRAAIDKAFAPPVDPVKTQGGPDPGVDDNPDDVGELPHTVDLD